MKGRIEANHEWLIRAIAEGGNPFDNNTMQDFALRLGLNLGTEQFCVIVQYSEEADVIADATRPTQLLNWCLKRSNEEFPTYGYIDNRFRVVLLICAGALHRDKIVNKLHGRLKKSRFAIKMGVGRCYTLEKVSYSRVEAGEALMSIVGQGHVAYIDDLYLTQSITTRKLENEKRKIVDLFKAGHLQQMDESMIHLAEHVRVESPVREGMPYPTSIRRTTVELLVEIMHLCSDAGVDVENQLNHQDPYSRIFEMKNTPDIMSYFSEVARILYNNMVEVNSKVENKMFVVAKSFIDENITVPGLSLQMVSEKLEITPAYFSGFFTREMGMGFNEYITSARIEMAKNLLTSTVKKINNIAKECGFQSASYFICVFRKQTGISPGEYRKIKK